MLIVSSVAGIFYPVIWSFMLLIIVGFYVLLKYATLMSRGNRPRQEPIGIVSPVISIEYTTSFSKFEPLFIIFCTLYPYNPSF